MKFVEFYFDLKLFSVQSSDVLTAQLFDLGFDSFENSDDYLKAYILNKKVNKNLFKKINNDLIVKNPDFSYKKLEDKNWNDAWESNFDPVFFQSGVIRSSFHSLKEKPKYDIIIDPKMSFGTGHHETTKLMIKAMNSLDFQPKKVLDFGCGTAVLSILAEKMWKSYILALDTDIWAYKNSVENLDLNSCTNIKIGNYGIKKMSIKFKFDLILANINTNVLLGSFADMTNNLKKNGILVLSGFYSSDYIKIKKEANLFGCSLINKFEDNDWQCLVFQNIK